jgi:hypothetical protein
MRQQQRVTLVINVGNLLECLGAGALVYGLWRLAGLAAAMVLLGVLLVVAAELVYDEHVWRIPLPRRPRPGRRLAGSRGRLRAWRAVIRGLAGSVR